MANLKEIFKLCGEKIPVVINLDEITSDGVETSMTEVSRLVVKFFLLILLYV
jgi:hypothetical protein